MNLTNNINNTLNIQENPLSKYARSFSLIIINNFDVINWANNLEYTKSKFNIKSIN